MKQLVTAACVLAVLGLVSVKAQDATGQGLAEELLTTMRTQQTIEQSFEMVKQMIPAQMAQMEETTGRKDLSEQASAHTVKIVEMLAEELSWDKMKGDYIALYAATFSEQEMKELIAFYKSPTGQVFLDKQPELMQRSMEMTQKMMGRVMPKIDAMMREFTEAAASEE